MTCHYGIPHDMTEVLSTPLIINIWSSTITVRSSNSHTDSYPCAEDCTKNEVVHLCCLLQMMQQTRKQSNVKETLALGPWHSSHKIWPVLSNHRWHLLQEAHHKRIESQWGLLLDARLWNCVEETVESSRTRTLTKNKKCENSNALTEYFQVQSYWEEVLGWNLLTNIQCISVYTLKSSQTILMNLRIQFFYTTNHWILCHVLSSTTTKLLQNFCGNQALLFIRKCFV